MSEKDFRPTPEKNFFRKEKFPNQLLEMDMPRLVADVDKKRVDLLVGSSLGLVDLAEGVVFLSNFIISERANALVLLDKSARPLAHLLTRLWYEVYPNYQIPEIRFINIGRNEEDKDSNMTFRDQLVAAHIKNYPVKKL